MMKCPWLPTFLPTSLRLLLRIYRLFPTSLLILRWGMLSRSVFLASPLFIYSFSLLSSLNTFKTVFLPKLSVTPELRIALIAWILVTPSLLFPFWELNLFLDDPEVSIVAAEGIARPTSVRLPYALIPGMDLSSSAYQKATALLSKVANEAASQLPASTGARLIPSDFGK